MVMTRKISEKKQYGVYYTPKRVADTLCAWAIRSSDEFILEPSFGGCDFLDASLNRFAELGLVGTNAKNQLYGCDIDENAFDFLTTIIDKPNGHFKQGDFLSFTLESFHLEQNGFDVVIGNPPYVSHHNMVDNQKEAAIKALENQDIKIGGRASLWAYFILHSISFLKLGGRMAWVLPSSFLYADYAKNIQKKIMEKFERCLVINLHERLFLDSGTEEISVITLCDNLHAEKGQGKIDFVSASDLNEMNSIIKKWNSGEIIIPDNDTPSNNFTSTDAKDLFDILTTHPNTKKLGEIFDVQIGIVSGANSFFILNKSEWQKNNLPNAVKTHILTKFRYSQGLGLNQNDIDTIEAIDAPCLLVDTTKAEKIDGNLKKYIDSFPEEKIKNTTTFTRRAQSGVWHKFNDHRIPEAFFPYMQNEGAWIVLNQAKVNTTNSIHRLYKKENVYVNDKLVAISILSSFSQVSSELVGRTYGAGVLKHEPSEANKILILLPDVDDELIDKKFTELDALFRQGLFHKARQAANLFLLNFYSDDIKKHFLSFDQELIRLQNRRYPLKKLTK